MRGRLMVLARVTALSVALSCITRAAFAEDAAHASRAEELFRKGKALLGERDYARACPLLAASYDLDPGTGVLLALAICHEGEGKLASASAEYKSAAERAKKEGRADRERVARDRALALESRLSTLAITPPREAWNASDFVIRRSGVVVARDAWDQPIALDGGEYVIEASASGKKPWRAEVALAPSSERRTVTIPTLESVAPVVPAASASLAAGAPSTPPPEAKQVDRSEAEDGGPSTLRMVGIGSMVAGVVGLGVGAFYAFRATSKYDDSNQNGCEGDTCVGQGKEDRLAARSAGNVATVCFAVGGTLAVGGVVLFVLGEGSDDTSPKSALFLQPRVSIESREVGLSLDGRF